MGKKKKEILDEAYDGFAEGMKNNGFSQAAITALWDTVLPFAGYAFNKSHAAGYGLVSFWTAYLKANYPAEYMAGLLTSVGDDKDKAAIYLADCRKMGITVLPPDVNASRADFAAVGEDIRFGLAAIRNVGSGVVASIIAAREEKGAFTNFSDYLGKIDITACNKKVTESLVKAGGFDSLGHDRKGLFLVHADAIDAVLSTKKAEAIGQFDLFGGAGGEDVGTDVFAVRVPEDEWETKHKLALERDMLGLYVSGHPWPGWSTRSRRRPTPPSVRCWKAVWPTARRSPSAGSSPRSPDGSTRRASPGRRSPSRTSSVVWRCTSSPRLHRLRHGPGARQHRAGPRPRQQARRLHDDQRQRPRRPGPLGSRHHRRST